MAPSEVASDSITGKKEIQFLGHGRPEFGFAGFARSTFSGQQHYGEDPCLSDSRRLIAESPIQKSMISIWLQGKGLRGHEAEKKQSHFWLCFEWRVGFKILF
jgi:hypothetical protein